MQAKVVRRLKAGQPVSVYIDGVDSSGSFDFSITEQAVKTCPETVLSVGLGRFAQYTTPAVMTPSCGFTEILNPIITPQVLSGHTFGLSIPAPSKGCFQDCTVSIRSSVAFAASMLDQGDCSGAELFCGQSQPDESGHQLSIEIDSNPEDQERTIIVTDQSSIGSSINISVFCSLACA